MSLSVATTQGIVRSELSQSYRSVVIELLINYELKHMSKIIKKLGLVVGRFQPLHTGHKFLIEKAIFENNLAVICIGSARETDPLTLKDRTRRLKKYLKNAEISDKKIKIVHVKDVETDELWVKNLIEAANITRRTDNVFYSADQKLPEAYLCALEKHGIHVNIVERITFSYKTPDGKIHRVSSATQIRRLHDRLKIPV